QNNILSDNGAVVTVIDGPWILLGQATPCNSKSLATKKNISKVFLSGFGSDAVTTWVYENWTVSPGAKFSSSATSAGLFVKKSDGGGTKCCTTPLMIAGPKPK